MEQFYGGTSGLQISLPKRDFPATHADKSRLAFYGIHENSIEINSSFYKLPQLKTVQRWAGEVPLAFKFTFKLWKEITHQKGLLFDADKVHAFMAAVAGAQEKKACLLVQLPPGLQVSAFLQLQELLAVLGAYDWRIAVEFRHLSWYNDVVYRYLNTHGIAMVIQDMPRSATPLEVTVENFVYLRFHGPSGNYKGSYSESFLAEYASYITEWQAEGKTVYAYFNNTAGAALANLHFLKSCLEKP
ncbi:MAG: DUF72 domain-containing protein [Mucilaginibacter sp.]|nr:DUF72 domain-containing protein [Mucilaginibacter sp.]